MQAGLLSAAYLPFHDDVSGCGTSNICFGSEEVVSSKVRKQWWYWYHF